MTLTEDHAPVYAEMLTGWKVAKRSKSIRVKLLDNVVDNAILEKLSLSTLEGLQHFQHGSAICLGETGEIWQRMPKTIFLKYDAVNIDPEGYLVCMPKAEQAIDCIQWNSPIITHSGEHYVRAQRGESFRTYGPCQRFGEGDYICRSRTDNTDVWVVGKKLFENTYTIIA